MTHILDDPDGSFLVLANDLGLRSLWPATLTEPAGWTRVHGPAGRSDCIRHIREQRDAPTAAASAPKPSPPTPAICDDPLVRHLTALVAVLHRRTGQSQVTVRHINTDTDGGTLIAVGVDTDDTTAALAECVAAATAKGDTEDGPADAILLTEDAPDQETPTVPVLRLSPEGELTGTIPPGDVHDGLLGQVRTAATVWGTDTVGGLDLLTPDEAAWLATVDGRTRAHADQAPPSVHELFSARAARTPDAVAVSCADTRLSYRDLDRLSDHHCRALLGAGAGAGGTVVPVMMARSPRLVAVLLGILKAGGAYLYLDPDNPDAHHQEAVETVRASVLVADPELAHRAPAGISVLPVSDQDTGLDEPSPAVTVTPDTPAYVCRTSGTTGVPLYVTVPHRAVVRLVLDPSWIDVAADDVFLQLAPLGFDASTFEIWMPLANGARLVVYPPGHVELDELGTALRSDGVTVLWLTAGLFHQMSADHPDAFGGLRHLLAGGDVVSPVHVARTLAAHPGLTFINGYGPTENTTFTATWSTRTAPSTSRVPIGRPVDGTAVAVLDERLRPVPRGVIGELWAGGDGLALGYLGWPEGTAERFMADPSAPVPGARMYRTGDLVRWNPDGTLDFLGRRDRQIKINGHRIDPAVVENELQRHDAVRAAAAVSQSIDDGRPRLIAYVTAAEDVDRSALAIELRRRLCDRLPAELVPWAVLVLDTLPLTANGKVDRGALPAARRSPRNVWNDYVMPRDRLEELLARVWGEVIEVEPIGVYDDFFDLGGHSLLAADLIGRLHRDHRIDLSARTLYMQPNIAAVADSLRDAETKRNGDSHVSLAQ